MVGWRMWGRTARKGSCLWERGQISEPKVAAPDRERTSAESRRILSAFLHTPLPHHSVVTSFLPSPSLPKDFLSSEARATVGPLHHSLEKDHLSPLTNSLTLLSLLHSLASEGGGLGRGALACVRACVCVCSTASM